MHRLHFFSYFAFVFYVLSIQGEDFSLSSDHVYNETKQMYAHAAVRQMFKEFVKTHNKTYVNDSEEYSRRLSIFKVVLFYSSFNGLSSVIVWVNYVQVYIP